MKLSKIEKIEEVILSKDSKARNKVTTLISSLDVKFAITMTIGSICKS